MIDSGFSGLPPTSGPGKEHFPPGKAELRAQITETRGELKKVSRQTRVKGEVVKHNRDGSIRIRTDKGEITVRIKGRDIPQEGQKVEIKISPGDPPKQATISPPRTEEAAPSQLSQSPEKPVSTNSQHIDTPLQPRTLPQTPVASVATSIPVSEEDMALKIQTPAPVQLDSAVRLIPLPANQISQFTQQIPEQIEQIVLQLIQLSPQIRLLDSNEIPKFIPEELGLILSPSTYRATPIQHSFSVSYPLQHQESQGLSPVLNPVIVQTTLQQISSIPQSIEITVEAKANMILFQPSPQQFSSSSQGGTIAPQTSYTGLIDVRITSITVPRVTLTTPANLKQQTANDPSPGLHSDISVHTQIHAPQTAGQITAQVTGITPQRLPVLSFIFPDGSLSQPFVMQFAATNLSTGTELQLIPLHTSSLQPSAVQISSSAAPAAELLTGSRWPAFDELVQTLQQIAPQALNRLSQTMPNPANPARMSPAILFFIAAVRGGDITGWLGDKTVDALKRAGKDSLLKRLTRDISGLNRISSEPVSQDWRATSLPLFWNGEVYKLQLFYRNQDNSNNTNEKDDGSGTRFLFDLNLSHIGELQLDGLHRPGKLDLIVRTKTAFSNNMQQTMRRTYINALEQTNMVGELSFQSKAARFVKIDLRQETIGIST